MMHMIPPSPLLCLPLYICTKLPLSFPLSRLLCYFLHHCLTYSSISLSFSLSASKDSRSAVVVGLISSKGIMSSYYSGRFDSHKPHFLESCFLCGKLLGYNSDIFMYRGNTPFCSKECRQEQIEIDESMEKKSWKLSSSSSSSASRSIRKSDTKESSPNKTVRTGTVVVA